MIDRLEPWRRSARAGSVEPWLRGVWRFPRSRGVTRSTVDRVKGMEWDHVVVFGADRGSMPLSCPMTSRRSAGYSMRDDTGAETIAILADEARPSDAWPSSRVGPDRG